MTFIQIHNWRKQLGLSRRDVADMLGYSYRTVQSWECGYTTPSALVQRFMQHEASPSKAKAIEWGVNTK